MYLLKFEVKKTLKHKKYLWALLVVILVTGALYWINANQRSKLQGNWVKYNAGPDFVSFFTVWRENHDELISIRDNIGLTALEERQLESSRELAHAIQRLRICFNYDRWEDINRYNKLFIDKLEIYTESGMSFEALDGIDRELFIAKNAWSLEHDIPYEFEEAPLSQHLFLKRSFSVLLGAWGIIAFLLLFGNTITEEKETSTWLTIKTQPITNTQLVLSKYINLLFKLILFIIFVIAVGLIIPGIYEGGNLNVLYPHIITEGDSFTIISTGQYLLQSILLFLCAGSITISIIILLSKWVNRSVILYILTAIILGIGSLTTSIVMSPLNPFYFLSFKEVLNTLPQSSNWTYILWAFIWTCLIITSAIYLPEAKDKLTQGVKDNMPFAKGKTQIGRKKLWNFYIFEWRKTLREGMFYRFIVCIIILVILGNLFLIELKEQREQEYLSEIEWRAAGNLVLIYEELLESSIEHLDDYKKRNPDAGLDDWILMSHQIEVYNYEEIVKTEREHQKKAAEAVHAYQEGDWQTFTQYQLYVNQITYDRAAQKSLSFTELVSIHEKEILMEKNIKPKGPGEFIPTIYQFGQQRMGWRGELVYYEQWDNQNKKIDNTGLFYLYLIFTHYIYLIPFLAILFLVGGGIAKEKGKKTTFNFIKTQPISQEKVFMGKILNSIAVVVIITLTIPIVVVLVGTVLNGYGHWNYPILHYTSFREVISYDYEGYAAAGFGYDFITLGQYLISSTILFMSLSLLVIVIANFVSLFFKKTITVWATTIIILIGGFWFNGRHPLRVSHISPFTYFNIPKVINGELATKLNNPRVNALTGAMVVLVLATVIIILGYWLINRKNFLKAKSISTGKKSIEKGI